MQRVSGRSRKGSALFVLVLCLGYVVALYWIDRDNGTLRRLTELAMPLAFATMPVLASYAVRYWRWSWLLRQGGHPLVARQGFPAYLSGFALTATPGKAGELLRMRYFARLGVPAERTVAAFVFERASDLLVILLLSLLAAQVFPTLGTLAAIVLTGVAGLFGVAAWPAALSWLACLGRQLPGRWPRHLAAFVLATATELGRCISAPALLRSLICGVLAWGLTSAVFVGLCSALGLMLPASIAWGIYPLAMLIGALSFIPGGVGTTELAVVLMLQRLGVPTADALAAAIGVRLVTLWFAVGVGALAVCRLEMFPSRTARQAVQ